MKLKKYLAKGIVLGMIISNLPIYSFANNIENKYYSELSNIETKEDLQKSAQGAVRTGEVDTWITGLANMPTTRNGLTSSVVDGKIYVIGGNYGSYLNKVEVYDPIADSWETKTSMPTSRSDLTSSVVDGKIYCIGGKNGNYLNTLEVYDTVTDSWETKTGMPTPRSILTSSVIDGKIYVIGGWKGSYLNTVEVYDPVTDSWETKTGMPTVRYGLTSSVVDGKIYCIGGLNVYSLNTLEVYDPVTDSWETKTPMTTSRSSLTSSVVDSKIYCIGGSNSSYLNTVEVYDPATDSWETKASMPTSRNSLTGNVVYGKIYCIGGTKGGTFLNNVEAYIAKISPEEQATLATSNAESTKDPVDIQTARNLVNQLPEGELKTQLQARLDAISPNISLERKNATSNLDLYIKCENMLLMSLDTNSITFDDFSGVTDMEKANAVNITVTSSLPYQLNAYLPVEIQSPDKVNTMDKTILNIKENSELTYQTFANTIDKIVLKDNCIAGNDINHGIDIKLKGGIAHEKDVYKTTIKFEAQQK